ncbi:unnamed protein product [Effrenium voratum]|nr:unnamed protein product [Effrenium voratum]
MVAQVKDGKDASKVVAEPSKGVKTRAACWICKRWFPSATHLKRHEKHSDLHRANLDKQDELTYQRKSELKLAVHCVRSRIVEVDSDDRALRNEETQSYRTLLEMQLRQLLYEYGQAQETIEDNRPRSRRRRGPNAPRGVLPQEKQPRRALHRREVPSDGLSAPTTDGDPMGFTDDGDLAAYRRRRSVEFKHGRISMLATMGFMTPEILGHWPGYISPSQGLKFADVPNGLAALQKVPSLGWTQILMYFGLIEYSAGFEDYRTGTPGDYGWKVLSSDDPEERRRKLNADLANGRLAMVAIMAILFQNGVAGTTGPEMWLPEICCDHLIERLPGNLQLLGVSVAEIVYTFVLCFVVLCVAVSERTKASHLFGLAIGSCVTVGGFAIGGISGGSLNPAVSQLGSGRSNEYIVAPLQKNMGRFVEDLFGIATSNLLNGGYFYKALIYTVLEVLGGVAAAAVFMVTHQAEVEMEGKEVDA